MSPAVRHQLAHVLKLIAAAIPAVVAVVAPDLATSVQGVLAAVTALIAAVELYVHGNNPPALPPLPLPPATEVPQAGYVPAELRK